MLAIVVGDKIKSEITIYSLKDKGYEVQFIDSESEKDIDDELLKEKGINRADLLITLTEKDELNMYLCKLAKIVHGVRKTVAVANLPDNITFMESENIDLVMCTSLFFRNSIDSYLRKGDSQCI